MIMKQEDKELLLRDLCGRLPYGVKVTVLIEEVEYDAVVHGVYADETVFVEQSPEPNKVHRIDVAHVSEVKPYLFPLGSHTSSEADRIKDIMGCNTIWYISHGLLDWSVGGSVESETFELRIEQIEQLMGFFHLNHFDYRGLIEAGLAIDATGLNIYKEETK
jgi:hypothetical protein